MTTGRSPGPAAAAANYAAHSAGSSPTAARALEWPLAGARRRHVKDQVRAAELPVKHEVWKFGSPHTLVLTKTSELFQREAKARKDAAASLEGWPPCQGVSRMGTRQSRNTCSFSSRPDAPTNSRSGITRSAPSVGTL
jgi:uncharacterized protein (DUF1810 family)